MSVEESGQDPRAAEAAEVKRTRAWLCVELSALRGLAEQARIRGELDRYKMLVGVILQIEERLSWSDAARFEIAPVN